VRQTIVYKEWLPDQPELGSEALIRADNVLPSEGTYVPFRPLTPIQSGSFTLPGIARGGFVSQRENAISGAVEYYAATNSTIYVATAGAGVGTFNAISSGWGTANSEVSFTQFGNLVFAGRGNGGVLYHTAGSATNFATVPGLTAAYDARHLAVLGQFLVIGNLGSATARSANIAWSGVGQPLSFPTPNSATAIAQQSGEQELNIADGPLIGIYGGDQYAILVQTGAVTRMTYVGPPVVFQFDKIENKKGAAREWAHAGSGRNVFMFSPDGFYVTDGVTVEPTGEGKVNKTFINALDIDRTPGSVTATSIIEGAYDCKSRCIFWATPSGATASAYSNYIYAHSLVDGRWTRCEQSMRKFIEPASAVQADGLYAFDSSNVLCKFSGTAGSAVFETSDAEFNPGGRSYIDGIKPNVQSSGTAPAMTTRIGYRDDLNTDPTYTSATSANSYNGFADFRVDAKYVRVEQTITGNFEKATGFVASFDQSSDR